MPIRSMPERPATSWRGRSGTRPPCRSRRTTDGCFSMQQAVSSTQSIPLERLAMRIQERSVRDGECMIWTGGLNGPADSAKYGYGLISFKDGDKYRRVMTHRVMYEWLVGPIPEGKILDHLCRRHACWEPSHLDPTTRPENTRRGMPYWDLSTHCRYGHEYTEENTYTPPGQPRRRQCRKCRARWDREREQRRQAEKAD